jgi:exonuclease V gamma subunit
LSQRIDVYLYLVDPSPEKSEDPASNVDILDLWGGSIVQSHRCLELLLDQPETTLVELEQRVPSATKILGALQRTILVNELSLVPKGQRDHSIQVHDCAGPTRQVEIARDVILHLLNGGVREEDIVMVVPDLRTFEPLIRSTFGPARMFGSWRPSASALPDLSYQIVDPGASEVTEFVSAVERLLDLLISRVDSNDVLGLLHLPEVRTRFKVSSQAVAMIESWVTQAKTVWGISGAHRRRFGVDVPSPRDTPPNSWGALLERLYLGLAIDDFGESMFFGSSVPLEVDIDDLGTVGMLASIIATIGNAAEFVRERHDAREWADCIERLVSDVIAPAPTLEWQVEAWATGLASIRGDLASFDLDLSFADFREMLARSYAMRPAPMRLFDGGMMICPPQTLRWIEHRIVMVLGFDEGAFDGDGQDVDDLLYKSHDFVVLTPADEARASLLSVVLQAREQLIIMRTGTSLRDNEKVETSVAMAELFDAVQAIRDEPTGKDAGISISHRRHGFHSSNFIVNSDVADATGWAPWSFSSRERKIAESFLSERGPFPAGGQIRADRTLYLTISELASVLTRPVEEYVRRTLDITLTSGDEDMLDLLPVELSALETWKTVSRFLPGSAAPVLRGPEWFRDLPDEERRAIVRRSLQRFQAEGQAPVGALWRDRESVETRTALLQRETVKLLRGRDCSLVPVRHSISLFGITVRLLDEVAVYEWDDGSSGPFLLSPSKRDPEKLVALALGLIATSRTDRGSSSARFVMRSDNDAVEVGTLGMKGSKGDFESIQRRTLIDATLAMAATMLSQIVPVTMESLLSGAEVGIEKFLTPEWGREVNVIHKWVLSDWPDDALRGCLAPDDLCAILGLEERPLFEVLSRTAQKVFSAVVNIEDFSGGDSVNSTAAVAW